MLLQHPLISLIHCFDQTPGLGLRPTEQAAASDSCLILERFKEQQLMFWSLE
jgi:hypothetical protein